MLLQSHTSLMNKVTKREMKMRLILLAKMMKIFQMNLMKIIIFCLYTISRFFLTLENKVILISTNMFSFTLCYKEKNKNDNSCRTSNTYLFFCRTLFYLDEIHTSLSRDTFVLRLLIKKMVLWH